MSSLGDDPLKLESFVESTDSTTNMWYQVISKNDLIKIILVCLDKLLWKLCKSRLWF